MFQPNPSLSSVHHPPTHPPTHPLCHASFQPFSPLFPPNHTHIYIYIYTYTHTYLELPRPSSPSSIRMYPLLVISFPLCCAARPEGSHRHRIELIDFVSSYLSLSRSSVTQNPAREREGVTQKPATIHRLEVVVLLCVLVRIMSASSLSRYVVIR